MSFSVCTGIFLGTEARVGPQHSPSDPRETRSPAGSAEGAHPPPQDTQPHPGTTAQHHSQVSTDRNNNNNYQLS